MVHSKSGTKIVTDAPIDNHGRGNAFSPTDLLASSLVSCMITVMAIEADKQGWVFENAKGSLTKSMQQQPRKVNKLVIHLDLDASLTGEQREKLENKAKHCPVALSLHPDIDLQLTFSYQ